MSKLMFSLFCIGLCWAQNSGSVNMPYNYAAPYTEEGMVRWTTNGGNPPISRRVPWYDSVRVGLINLNETGQCDGVTPINGGLSLRHVDLVVRGRGLNFEIARNYSSKIWYSTRHDSQTTFRDTLRPYTWLGKGWDMQWGEFLRASGQSGAYNGIYLTPSGQRVKIKDSLSIDGSFLRYENNRVVTKQGTGLKFMNYCIGDYYFVERITDVQGNYIKFTRSFDQLGDWPNVRDVMPIDTIYTSLGDTVKFYWHGASFSGTQVRYILLDSIKYRGKDDAALAIRYRYVQADADTSPFGSTSFADSLGAAGRTWLLRAVVYPNNDSVYYEYNRYLELARSVSVTGGREDYRYSQYTYRVPDSIDVSWPGEIHNTTRCYFKRTRAVDTIYSYDPISTVTCTTRYVRKLTINVGGDTTISNPDSVVIHDAAGNKMTMRYKASMHSANLSFYKWYSNSGELDATEGIKHYDSSDNLLLTDKSFTKEYTLRGKKYWLLDSAVVVLGTRVMQPDIKTTITMETPPWYTNAATLPTQTMTALLT